MEQTDKTFAKAIHSGNTDDIRHFLNAGEPIPDEYRGTDLMLRLRKRPESRTSYFGTADELPGILDNDKANMVADIISLVTEFDNLAFSTVEKYSEKQRSQISAAGQTQQGNKARNGLPAFVLNKLAKSNDSFDMVERFNALKERDGEKQETRNRDGWTKAEGLLEHYIEVAQERENEKTNNTEPPLPLVQFDDKTESVFSTISTKSLQNSRSDSFSQVIQERLQNSAKEAVDALAAIVGGKSPEESRKGILKRSESAPIAGSEYMGIEENDIDCSSLPEGLVDKYTPKGWRQKIAKETSPEESVESRTDTLQTLREASKRLDSRSIKPGFNRFK